MDTNPDNGVYVAALAIVSATLACVSTILTMRASRQMDATYRREIARLREETRRIEAADKIDFKDRVHIDIVEVGRSAPGKTSPAP